MPEAILSPINIMKDHCSMIFVVVLLRCCTIEVFFTPTTVA